MLAPITPSMTDGKMRVTVIPAKPQNETAKKKSGIKRVAAYCRVSTDVGNAKQQTLKH